MKDFKQADLLLRERSGRSGRFHKLRDGRPLSFIKKYGADCIVAAGSYAAFVYALGWIVPTGIFILIAAIVWACATNEGEE